MSNSFSSVKSISEGFRHNPNVSVSVLDWHGGKKRKCKKCGVRVYRGNHTGFCLKCRAKLLRSKGSGRFKPLRECLPRSFQLRDPISNHFVQIHSKQLVYEIIRGIVGPTFTGQVLRRYNRVYKRPISRRHLLNFLKELEREGTVTLQVCEYGSGNGNGRSTVITERYGRKRHAP